LHPRIIQCSPGLGVSKDRYLRRRNLRWVDDITYGPLAQRGWASIERVLAPRILHFTKDQMIYECAAGYKFEASRIPDKKTGSGQVRSRYTKASVQPFITGALSSSLLPSTAESKTSTAAYIDRLEAWHQTIDQLSKGKFSSPLDKLPAIASFAQIIDNGSLGSYLAGIWSKNIGYGLSWSRVYRVLEPSPVYRAPSWSWASVNNETSSIMLHWSPTLLEDQAKDPSWIERYGPKLVSEHIILRDEREPYGNVMEGSHIVLSGLTLGFHALIDWLKGENNEPKMFRITFVLDQSWMFDCPCCGEKHSSEERKSLATNFQKDIEHHSCLILQGDGWETKDGAVEIMVLRKREGKGDDEYERVGFLRLELEFYYKPRWENEDRSYNKAPVKETFDGMGWERRALKLY